MLISRIDTKTDQAALRACFELFDAGQRLDDPVGPPVPDQIFAIRWTDGFDDSPRETWLATDEGRPVGCYLLELPAHENRHVGFCQPVVPPALRRRGIGSALLRHCTDRARLAGRSTLVAEVPDESAAAGFASAVGARRGNTELRKVLDLRDPELAGRVAGLAAGATAASAGYQVRRWTGLTPEEHLSQVAALTVAMNDAPSSDGIDDEVLDPARVRAGELQCLAHGRSLFQVAAFATATSQIAGWTAVAVDEQVSHWGRQHDTVVAREHRGRRLGMLMKIRMLELLAELAPQVERIITANGDRNLHMAAINDQLGFKDRDAATEWLLDITAS